MPPRFVASPWLRCSLACERPHLFACRRMGITVPLADAIIATVAIDNNLELWTYDSHFALMQTALPALRLFVEPP